MNSKQRRVEVRKTYKKVKQFLQDPAKMELVSKMFNGTCNTNNNCHKCPIYINRDFKTKEWVEGEWEWRSTYECLCKRIPAKKIIELFL